MLPVKVSGAEGNAVPAELAGFRWRLGRQGRGSSFHERSLRSLGVNTLNPELDVAVLARDPADPRIEAPASKKPCRDTGCLHDRYDLPDNSQLPFGARVHICILPQRAGLRLGHWGRKPWLVVSNNQRNMRLDDVLTARVTASRKPEYLDTVVELTRADLPLTGYVLCDDIFLIYKDEILGEAGALTPGSMRRVDDGLRAALGL